MTSIPSEEDILHRTIVIHPGSLWLRIGRASDPQPLRLLHALARHRLPDGCVHRDPFLPPIRCHKRKQSMAMVDERLRQQRSVLRRLRTDTENAAAEPTSPAQRRLHNSTAEPRVCDEPSKTPPYTTGCNGESVIISDDLLAADPVQLRRLYNVHFPMHRGDLNGHSSVGGSRQSIITDMHLIWVYALCEHLQIDHDQLRSYRAVLVVPDTFDRAVLRELMTLLLSENHGLGFASALLVQDHVMATYGAGRPSACVVDLGDQKVSVSCVDRSVSTVASRVRFGHGLADVAQVMRWLLRDTGLDERLLGGALDKAPQNVRMAMGVRRLAADWLHLNCAADDDASSMLRLDGRRPGDVRTECEVRVGDVPLLAAMALFDCALFAVTGVDRRPIRVQARRPTDAEDYLDEEFLCEIWSKHRGAWPDCNDFDMPDEGLNEVETELITATKEDIDSADYRDQHGRSVGLARAIAVSIERCCASASHSDDRTLREQLYGNVLLVGGGSRIDGLPEYLRGELQQTAGETVVGVTVGSRNGGPADTTSWLGATIMAGLNSAGELFVSGDDWRKCGVRLLRERAPFEW